MHTVTKDLILPTTVTGSWPRPLWYTENLNGAALSARMLDLQYREQLTDAVSCVISDQEQAGLDILTNGDYHLDLDLGGLSWLTYVAERVSGVSAERTGRARGSWDFPAGSLLREISRAARWPVVEDRVVSGIPLEFDKLWRLAQGKTRQPVKFGAISADFAALSMPLADDFRGDRQQVMWDVAELLNAELRKVVSAGCRVVQIEEPAFHSATAINDDEPDTEFLVDVYHRMIQGLDEAEIWVHTCWGNGGGQDSYGRAAALRGYEETMDIYMTRLKADVVTFESKSNDHEMLALFAPYKDALDRKIAIGFLSHRTLHVEEPAAIAHDIRRAMEYIAPEQLILSSDCGFGRQGASRAVAFYKAASLVQAANEVRRELGAPETYSAAADPRLQLDD